MRVTSVVAFAARRQTLMHAISSVKPWKGSLGRSVKIALRA